MRQHQPDAGFPLFLLGFLCAVIIIVCLAVWNRDAQIVKGPLSATDFSTLIAGFGGAVIGGGMSWLSSHMLGKQAARQQIEVQTAATERAARELGKSQALRVIMKLALASSNITSLYSHIQRNLSETEPGPAGELWQRITPLVGRGQPETLNTDDLAVLIEGKEYLLVQELIHSFHQYQALCEGFETFLTLRAELLRELPVERIRSAFYHPAKPDLPPKLSQQVEAVDSLVEGMTHAMPRLLERMRDIQGDLTKAFRKHLRDESIPNMRARSLDDVDTTL